MSDYIGKYWLIFMSLAENGSSILEQAIWYNEPIVTRDILEAVEVFRAEEKFGISDKIDDLLVEILFPNSPDAKYLEEYITKQVLHEQ